MANSGDDTKPESEAEFQRRRQRRNLAIIVVLLGFAILVYILGMVKMGAA